MQTAGGARQPVRDSDAGGISEKHKFTKKLFGELVVAALPYVVIGILLMCYNYARFESPFEFGQAYQLTAADQSHYGSIASYFSQTKMIAVANAVLYNFVNYNPICEAFPYVIFNGILLNFPILWFAVIGLSPEGVLKRMKEQQMRAFIVMLFVIPLVIAIMDALWSPFMTERYRMDQYWIMGVLCFLVIGFYHDNLSETAGRKFKLLYLALGVHHDWKEYSAVSGAERWKCDLYISGSGGADQDDPASGNRCGLMPWAAVCAGKQ